MARDSSGYLTELHRFLYQSFKLDEIQTLCSQLNIGYESLAGDEIESLTWELLSSLARFGRLQELITIVQRERPYINWPAVPDGLQLPASPPASGKDVLASQVNASGDVIQGDKIQGDKVQGDKFAVGDVEDSAIAVGPGAVAKTEKTIHTATYVEKQFVIQGIDASQLGQLLELPDTYQFYESLLRLNFIHNVKSFNQFRRKRTNVGAFLIHGEPDSGQRWLLNKLYRLLHNQIEAKIIKRDFRRLSRRNGVDDIWRELGNQIGLRHTRSPELIAEKVCGLCQTKPVIIVFFGVEQVPGTHVSALIEEFWTGIVSKAPQHAMNHPLLLFLVDYENRVKVDQAYLCEIPDESWHPTKLIRLPLHEVFSSSDLTSWLEHESEALPEALIIEIDDPLQEILRESDNGIPELVFDAICFLSHLNWDEEKEKWLKI